MDWSFGIWEKNPCDFLEFSEQVFVIGDTQVSREAMKPRNKIGSEREKFLENQDPVCLFASKWLNNKQIRAAIISNCKHEMNSKREKLRGITVYILTPDGGSWF